MTLTTVQNGQVACNLVGHAGNGNALYYLSVLGTATELLSLKASLVAGRGIDIQSQGTYRHAKGQGWHNFKSAIPGTPIQHYIWIADKPEVLIVTDPAGAPTAARIGIDDPRRADMMKLSNELRSRAEKEEAPKLLVRYLNTHTALPIPPEWGPTIFHHARDRRMVVEIGSSGDCTRAWTCTTDKPTWVKLVTNLVANGTLN